MARAHRPSLEMVTRGYRRQCTMISRADGTGTTPLLLITIITKKVPRLAPRRPNHLPTRPVNTYRDGTPRSTTNASPNHWIHNINTFSRYNEDKTQPAPLLSSPLQPAGYSNSYYWANSQDPHQSSLGGQVSAASATAAATTTITNPVVTSSPPFYGNFVPVTQPLSSWPSDSTSVFAANHPETDGTYGFGHHHDQRLGSTGHLEMPFSADMHNSPPSSGSGAQDARYHGAAGDDAQGYEATPQDLPGRGGSH